MKPMLQWLSQKIVDAITQQQARGVLASLYLALLIKIRLWLIRIAHDPLITFTFHGTPLHFNLSHNLPLHVRSYPDYALNLGEIMEGVIQKYPQAAVIDIGANIGDSVVILKRIQDIPVLCIEGDEMYFKLLQHNTRRYTHVALANTFVGQSVDQVTLSKAGGTGQLVRPTPDLPTAQTVVLQPLPAILDQYPQFASVKLLKIDTDGMDIEILRSTENWLNEVKPILFIEYYPRLIPADQRDPQVFIHFLKRTGYTYGLAFMNTGEMILSFNLEHAGGDSPLVDLHYFSLNSRQDTFYDLCLIHQNDQDVFQSLYQHFRSKQLG
jgi:FkbM family methyltransferase